MQSFLGKIFGAVAEFLSPGNFKRIVLQLKDYWDRSDVSGRMLLMLFFAPAIVVLFWMLGYIAYIVVFTLPGIVLTIIAQAFLFGIFWSGAVYFYEKLRSPVADKAEKSEKIVFESEPEEPEKKSERGFSWRKKS